MTQDEFPDDLIRHCEQKALEAVASDTAGLVRAVLRASGYADIVAERDKWERAYAAECAEHKTTLDEANFDLDAAQVKNAELMAALEWTRLWITAGHPQAAANDISARIDAALAADTIAEMKGAKNDHI